MSSLSHVPVGELRRTPNSVGPTAWISPVLLQKGIDPPLQTKPYACAVHRAGTVDLDVKRAPEEIRMIIVRGGGQTLTAGKHQRDFEFRFGTELKVRLGGGIGCDEKRITGGADFTRQMLVTKQPGHSFHGAIARFKHLLMRPKKHHLTHREIPKPTQVGQVARLESETPAADSVNHAGWGNCRVFVQVINVITKGGRQAGIPD